MKVLEENVKPAAEGAWGKVKKALAKFFTWFVRYPLALMVAVIIIAGVAIALALGVGDRFNVGGLLGKLFGKNEKPKDRVLVANKVPEGRVDEEGEKIPVGTPDSKGIVQRPVEVLEQPKNPFRDKTKLKVKTPEGEEKVLTLPDGVEDTDVDKVFQIQPEVYKVEVVSRPEGRVSDDDLKYLE
jgi:hypothetical protein